MEFIKKVMNLVTGYIITLGKHMLRLNISEETFLEDSYHFLCEFCAYFFQNLSEIRGINPWVLIDFMDQSQWEG